MNIATVSEVEDSHYRHPLPPKTHKDLEGSTFWALRAPIPRHLSNALMISTALFPIALWIVFTWIHGSSRFLPSPSETIDAAIVLWNEKGLLTDIIASSSRVVIAFLLAAAIGIPLGLMAGAFRSMEAMILPLAGAIRYMPVTAFVPLIIMWVGIGESSKILIIFMGVIFVNILMIADAVKFVPLDMVNSAYTLGASRTQVLRKVILPAIAPSIVDTLRVNVSGAWNFLVIAELLASSEGLGFRIIRAQRFLQTEDIFVCILLIGAIGVALDLSFRMLSRHFFKWAHEG